MDLSTTQGRKNVIDKIESNENKGRKASSYKASEILNDRMKPYVVEELREMFSEQTVKELPVVSSVNIAKRLVNSLACIYKDAPEREWTDLNETQTEIIKEVYSDMMANKKLNLANKVYKNHDQGLLQIIPKNGKLIMRVLKPHHYDIVERDDDPEVAKAIIISSYDNSNELMEDAKSPDSATGYQTTYESNIDTYKDQKAINSQEKNNKRYLVWTVEESFFMNHKGELMGDPTPSPLAPFGLLPFVEFSVEKEFEYWVRTQNNFSNFTIDFCASMTSVAQVVKLQGFSQAILKGPQDLILEDIRIGPNYVLKLPVDANSGIETSFEYANPGSDIQGSLQYLETLLTTFLSSNGIDPKSISMNGDAQTYSSGIERLLATIEKVSAAREDFDTFENIEQKVWSLIKAWLLSLSKTDTLDRKYRISSIPLESQVKVEYSKPELVKSDMEELDIISREIELGIGSPISAIMVRENLSREQAEERYNLYAQDLVRFTSMPEPINNQLNEDDIES